MTKLTLQEAVKIHPDLPVIVFVDNYELADGYYTTAQGISKVEVAIIASWDERIYDDEESFIEAYCSYRWREGIDEKKLEAKAHELWEKHATECIVCYSHATAMPKGFEVTPGA